MFGEPGRRRFLINLQFLDNLPILRNLPLILLLLVRPIAFLLIHLRRHLRLPFAHPLRNQVLAPGLLLTELDAQRVCVACPFDLGAEPGVFLGQTGEFFCGGEFGDGGFEDGVWVGGFGELFCG
jgi:hypothetical protein